MLIPPFSVQSVQQWQALALPVVSFKLFLKWATVNHYRLEFVNIAEVVYAGKERFTAVMVLWLRQIIPFPFSVLAPC